jgi:hypothetical protein
MNNQSELASGGSVVNESGTERPIELSSQLQCGPLLGCTAALLGGLLTWAVLQAVLPVFTLPEELANLPSPVPAEKAVELDLAMARINRYHAILAVAILGLAVGGLLAAAESYSRGSWRRVVGTGLPGGAIAGLFGAGAALAGSLVLEAPQALAGWSPLAKTVVVQAVTFAGLGLGIGVGLAVPRGNLRLTANSAIGGTLGGLLAALIYPSLVGYLLPITQTERVMPRDALSRLIWLAMASLLIGIILTGLGRRNRRQRQPASPPSAAATRD